MAGGEYRYYPCSVKSSYNPDSPTGFHVFATASGAVRGAWRRKSKFEHFQPTSIHLNHVIIQVELSDIQYVGKQKFNGAFMKCYVGNKIRTIKELSPEEIRHIRTHNSKHCPKKYPAL